MPKPRRNTPLASAAFPFKQRKPVPHQFVLDAIASLSPYTRPMFGCLAICVKDKIVLILRDKPESIADNGMRLATSEEHHNSLRSEFPQIRSIQVLRKSVTLGRCFQPMRRISGNSPARLRTRPCGRSSNRKIARVAPPRKEKDRIVGAEGAERHEASHKFLTKRCALGTGRKPALVTRWKIWSKDGLSTGELPCLRDTSASVLAISTPTGLHPRAQRSAGGEFPKFIRGKILRAFEQAEEYIEAVCAHFWTVLGPDFIGFKREVYGCYWFHRFGLGT